MTTKTITKDEASSSAIIVKNAILARSGVYVYSYDEMVRRGYTPEVKKDFYKEYRPASVLAAAKDKFKYAVLTKEHPNMITNDNIKQVVEGVVGSNIDVVVLENDEIALQGEIAFYTTDAVDYYASGAKETSAQYNSKVVPVFNEDYDFILEEIQDVQGLALTLRGRGGPSVAVLDSLISAGQKDAEKNIQGDKIMSSKNSILSFIGIGKSPQDELSSLVMDSLTGYSDLSETEKKARRDKVDNLINPLTETPDKKILIDTVKDCFTYSKEVLEKKDEVSKGLKAIYGRCVSTESVALQATLDSIKSESKDSDDEDEDDEKKKAAKDAEEKAEEEKKAKAAKDAEDEEKAKETKDSLGLEATIETIVTRVADSMKVQIDDAVKKHLGIEVKTGEETKDSILPSFVASDKDNSFLLKNLF